MGGIVEVTNIDCPRSKKLSVEITIIPMFQNGGLLRIQHLDTFHMIRPMKLSGLLDLPDSNTDKSDDFGQLFAELV